jgi:hypothetical protein
VPRGKEFDDGRVRDASVDDLRRADTAAHAEGSRADRRTEVVAQASIVR